MLESGRKFYIWLDIAGLRQQRIDRVSVLGVEGQGNGPGDLGVAEVEGADQAPRNERHEHVLARDAAQDRLRRLFDLGRHVDVYRRAHAEHDDDRVAIDQRRQNCFEHGAFLPLQALVAVFVN